METESGAEFISTAHVRHVMRYVKAMEWIDYPTSIIDAACGAGYGTKLLADHPKVKEIWGIDNNQLALDEAQKDKSRCQFIKTDILKANLSAKTIVSIETVEHFTKADGARLLRNFRNWLPANGILIISTPYCQVSGPSPITKQHLWEYSLTDFEEALNTAGFAVQLMRLERDEGQAGRLGYCMVKAVKK